MKPRSKAFGPELFFGFVGAVGADIELASRLLQEELKSVDYDSYELRLSKLLTEFAPELSLIIPPTNATCEVRIAGLMAAGNSLREKIERGDALAMLAIADVEQYRNLYGEKPEKGPNKRRRDDLRIPPITRQAYIFNSLKHPDEVQKLREIYGENFILISLYSPREKRIERLVELIQSTHKSTDRKKAFEDAADQLVADDEKQEGLQFGQSVRDVFYLADFFVKEANEADLRAQLNRVVKLLFRHPCATPTVEEQSMFFAHASALRSADLSRQVGAVIACERGEILATGCNEVPRAHGGAFWDGLDDPNEDHRDYAVGRDTNAQRKNENFKEIFEALKSNGMLSKAAAAKSPDDLVEEALYDKANPYLKNSAVASIIEYGRIVHAEMSALTEAARMGHSIQGATLYCTTYPCHMCARHILAAGISRVLYIEPYPKSLTKTLYSHSVTIEGEGAGNTVNFAPFVGAAPRIYQKVFTTPGNRKNSQTGEKTPWQPLTALPRLRNVSEMRYLWPESAEKTRFLRTINGIKVKKPGRKK